MISRRARTNKSRVRAKDLHGMPRQYNGGKGSTRMASFQRRGTLPVPPGHVRCPECLLAVTRRADGQPRAHQSRVGISCPGATPSGPPIALCAHGNTPRERKATCGCPFRVAVTA